jgi:hypothetical protein
VDHRQRAREWLKITEGVSPDHINDCAAEAQVNALTAIGHALLDVADAIREQTAALTGDDKRAILVERNQ